MRDVRVHVGARSGGARRGGLNPTGSPGLVRWALLGQETVLLSGADLTARAFRDWTAHLPAGRRYYVVAYASLALSLARELLDGGIELAPGPAIVICGGESLSAAHAEVIARGFRCRTVNRYSALEAAFVAQTCPDYPALLHVNSERAILRVVRPDGTPAEASDLTLQGWSVFHPKLLSANETTSAAGTLTVPSALLSHKKYVPSTF